MSINEKRIRESNRDTTLLLIPIVAILGKLVQFYILPMKYFYDSYRMQHMMRGSNEMGWWEGYETTINIFNRINIFNFNNTRQWSIALGIVGTILMIILISRCQELSMMESIYSLMAAGLMNIYVFNLAKEPIQMAFFLVIAIIIMLPIKNVFVKVILCAGVYFWESNTFRSYYIIMAAMTILLFFIFYRMKNAKNKLSKKKIVFYVVLCFVAMFIFMYASQFVDYEAYSEALNIRDAKVNAQAASAIINIVEVNGNYVNFMINYVFASVRMMFPIELLIKSPVYAPFFIYQIFILIYWIRALKNIKSLNNDVLLALTCFTAYLFGSFIFEPDFGSWVRHEAATFPIFYFMAFEYLGKKEDSKYEVLYER